MYLRYKTLTPLELAELETKRANINIQDEATIREYYELRKNLATFTSDMQTVISHPDYCLPFLQPGRLVHVKFGDYDFGWGAVVTYKSRKTKNPNEELEAHQKFIVDVLLETAEGASTATRTHTDLPSGVRPPQEGEKCQLAVVPVLLSCVQALSHVRIFLPKEVQTTDSRNSVKRALQEVKKRFPDGVALLDPIENMNIKDDSFKKLLRVSCFVPSFVFRLVN
jgi:ATP-dependent RNA helicase DOB1